MNPITCSSLLASHIATSHHQRYESIIYHMHDSNDANPRATCSPSSKCWQPAVLPFNLVKLLLNDHHAFLPLQALATLNPSTVANRQPCRCLSNPPFIYPPLLFSLPRLSSSSLHTPSINWNCITSQHLSIALHLTTNQPTLASHSHIHPPEHRLSTHSSPLPLPSPPLRNHARLHHRRHPGHGWVFHGCRPSEPAASGQPASAQQHNHCLQHRDQTLRCHLCSQLG
jgi:hypothetical protein